jgi:hypothetical protein
MELATIPGVRMILSCRDLGAGATDLRDVLLGVPDLQRPENQPGRLLWLLAVIDTRLDADPRAMA